MAMDRTARPSLSASEHRGQLRRALIASTIGTTIEWYDFLLYSTVTGLVFAKLFFPDSDPLIGTLQAYVIFYIGFIARPVGAAIFGHYGDRIGRKASLIATLVITGLATVAVGLVPTYEQIGIWAALIMIVLRFIQGVGVGGEWGGSVLMSMEWAQTNANRGFIASWPQFGGPAGIALANLAVLAFSAISGDQFLVWGWRIPFLISIIMVGVGLYIRLGVLETPVFAELVEKERLSSSPVVEVLRRQPKEVILSAFVRMGEQGPGYVYIAFIFTLRHASAWCLPQPIAIRDGDGGNSRFPMGPDRRSFVGPHRPPAHVYSWMPSSAACMGLFTSPCSTRCHQP